MTLTSWILSKGEETGVRFISKFLWPPASAFTIILEDDKLLVVRTSEYLMLPGGIADRGETLSECAVRETREETGLEINILSEINTQAEKFGGIEKMFHAEKTGGELNGSWEGQPEYIDIDKIDQEDWRGDRDVKNLLGKIENK